MAVSPMLFSTLILVYLSLLASLLYFHMGPNNPVDSINWLGGRNFTPEEWQRLVQHRIQRARRESEGWLNRARARQRRIDALPGRVRSFCPELRRWQGRVPCPTVPRSKANATRLETEHFQPYNDSFLLPHYERLGRWTVSRNTPTFWVVDIPAEDLQAQTRLRCAEVWLNFSRVFDPIGSLDGTLLRAVLSRASGLSIRSRVRDHAFRAYLTAVLTRQAAWLEGTELPPDKVAKVVAGFRPGNLSRPEQTVIRSFARGLQLALDTLVPRELSSWTFAQLSSIHGEVCRAENPPLLGRPRFGTHNIPYGLTVPNALGYEVPYLTKLFTQWLHLVAEMRCSSPILFALDSFLVFYHIHPFMDCNTRVSEILMNAILMSYDLPPVQLLLFMDKRTLRKLQDEAAKGLRDGFYQTMLQQINESAEFILQYDYIRSLPP
eukprot:RCo049590